MADTRCTVENVIGFGICTRNAKWRDTHTGQLICGTHAAQRYGQRYYDPARPGGWQRRDWRKAVTSIAYEPI